jgi:fumarylacetoacetase
VPDETHRADLRCWVESAADPDSDFPIQNLPLGMFRRSRNEDAWRAGMAIGDQILDLASAAQHGLIDEHVGAAIERASLERLNPLMALGRPAMRALRKASSALLSAETEAGDRARQLAPSLLVSAREVELGLPAHVGDYTDFYASVHHATNVGKMLRPDNPLLPNYKWVPIGYHGRASSLLASGASITRPSGQTFPEGGTAPRFGPSLRLDYELEIGAFIGSGNDLGEPVPIERAEEHLFGLCLVNDWSARDIQAWEYQPLGPVLAKSFATSVSPWVVTLDALEPYRVPLYRRPEGDPAPLDYLRSDEQDRAGGFAITVEAYLTTQAMRERGDNPVRLSRARFAEMYWSLGQMVAHHTSNGCNLRPGDLIASGTVSGATKESRGCLLELTWRGTEPLALPGGEERRFLEDGDEVTFRAHCVADGFARIGFGDVVGRIAGGGEKGEGR